jgi:hypothetical protein
MNAEMPVAITNYILAFDADQVVIADENITMFPGKIYYIGKGIKGKHMYLLAAAIKGEAYVSKSILWLYHYRCGLFLYSKSDRKQKNILEN